MQVCDSLLEDPHVLNKRLLLPPKTQHVIVKKSLKLIN